VPFYRHLPIRGFSNAKFRVEYATVKLQAIADLNIPEVDVECMRREKLIGGGKRPVKVLGGAVLNRPIVVVADKFSSGAAAEIERVGGKAVFQSGAA
jgi:large subunit ribosomal protein L15